MAVLDKAEAEFVASLTTALWWVIREGDRNHQARNSSTYFLDAGHQRHSRGLSELDTDAATPGAD